MAMEKYGVDPKIQHEELRNEEAQLMTKMASLIHDPDSEEKKKVETRLHSVRNELTRLDTVPEVQEDVPGEALALSPVSASSGL
jgi:hypothetical protein